MASVAVDREIRRRLSSAGAGLGEHPHAHHRHHHHHHHHHAAAAAMAAMALPANKLILSPGKAGGVVLAPAPGHKRRAAPPPPPPADDAPAHAPPPAAPAAHPLAAKRRKHGSGAAGVRDDMFQHYQPWVIHTYGDSAKTKTITLRKYARIVRTLRGEETNSVENSKFRFWVKAKGFRLGQPPGYVAKPADGIVGSQTLSGGKDARDDPPLYVPTSAAKIAGGRGGTNKEDQGMTNIDGFGGGGGGGNQFKKVAVVENFFDIIYSVHVEMEGRAGKHAGQKRTYRTITETYAFLPREAVTRFLLGCTDCQRRPRSRSASPSPCTSPAPPPAAAAAMQPPPPAPSPPPPPQVHHSPHQSPHHLPAAPPPPPQHHSPQHHSPLHHPPLHQPHLLHHPLSQLHLQQFQQHQHALLHSLPPLPPPPPVASHAALAQLASHAPPSPPPPPPPPPPQALPETPSPQPPLLPRALPSPRPLSPPPSSPDTRRTSCSPAPTSPSPAPPPEPPPPPATPADADATGRCSPCSGRASPATPPRLSPAPPPAPPASPPAAAAPAMRLFNSNALHVAEPVNIDFSLPITTTYLKHMRSLGYTDEDALRMDTDDNVSTPEADGSEDDHFSGVTKEAEKLRQMLLAWNGHAGRNGDMRLPEEREGAGEEVAGLWAGYHGALGLKKSTPPGAGREQSSPLMLSDRSLTQETSSVHDETSSSGNKEDEDDDDDEAEDKIDPQQYDPERLKAFNMFVRLFVDENLDRIVPISKQPKEKIQAIIDSCTRQFPEFAERARKRIRTYLKSCRRNKRSRDSNGAWDAVRITRPTPAHLTSVQAEQILAQACENESHNAKRMRLGLEPVSQPMPLLPNATVDGRPSPLEHYTSAPSDTKLSLTSSALKAEPISHATEVGALSPASFGAGGAGVKGGAGGGAPTGVPAAVTSASLAVNGTAAAAAAAAAAAPTSVYRPNFSQAFQRAATAAAAATAGPYAAPAMFGGAPFATSGGMLSNGPTDLSMKTKPLLSHKLNTAEMAAVRQLITGYRESAAFLLRSADELEQLLLQQQ